MDKDDRVTLAKGRDSGILVLRNGVLIGGGPYFWSTGSYTGGNGTWKGKTAHESAYVFR